MPISPAKKNAYCKRLITLLNTHSKVLMVTADNVGSKQLQSIRTELRGKATVLMGKNTLIRRALRDPETLNIDGEHHKNPTWDSLLPYVKGNVGFVFTNGDIAEVRKIVLANKVGAPAKAGVRAPCDVTVPKGPTGMDPTQTSFFQALNIATMISRGQIEIKSDVELIKEGDRVGPSEAALLTKLQIRPFAFGLITTNVFDSGFVYPAKVLDFTQSDIMQIFVQSMRYVAALSFSAKFPTAAAVPHLVHDGFQSLLGFSISTNYNFKQSLAVKEFLKDPSKFAKAGPAATGGAAAAAAAEPEPEPEPEEEAAPVGDLFGGGGDY